MIVRPCRVLLATLTLLALAVPLLADEIDDIVEARMKEQGIPGLTLAVERNGQTIKRKAYGLANVELKAPATEETIYEIGSITKSFTATLILDLVEEGKIDLDASISTYLPDLPEAWKDVSVRQLLNHTSGIKSYTSVGDFVKLARNDHTASEIIKMVSKAPLEFEPGEKWAYNNTGYYLLGMIVEKVGGHSLGRELSDRILKPLGMSETRPNNPNGIIPNRARGYAKLFGLLLNRDPITPTSAFSAGFLVSNVDDMLKWAAAQNDDPILTSESRAAMTTPTKLNDGSERPYGFGWGVQPVFGHRHIAHGGGTAGFATLVSIYPDDRLTIVILTNLASANVGAIERAIARHLLPDMSLANATPIDDPEPEQSARIRDVVAKLLKDEVPTEEFTPGFAKFIASDDAKRVTRELAKNGEITSMDLIGRKSADDSTRLSYRTEIGKARYLITASLDGKGKIAGLRAERDDTTDNAAKPRKSDAQTTSEIQEIITSLLMHDVPAGSFTPEFATFLASDEARKTSLELAKEGELGPLELIERRDVGDTTVLSYRGTVGKSPYRFTVTRDAEGQISALRIEKGD
jgi:CubicO group peptidase (beta-lactamase class C family)